jgi:hypothetical protein
MGLHARMHAVLCAALVLAIAASASPAGAMSVVVRAETNGVDVLQAFVPRQAATLTSGGAAVDGCPSDSPIAALRQVLPQAGDLVVDHDAGTGAVTVHSVKKVPVTTLPGPEAGGPHWVVYYGGTPVTDPCTSLSLGGGEVLAYLQCGTGATAVQPNLSTNPCFTGRPLTIAPVSGNIADVNPFKTQGALAAIVTQYGVSGDPFTTGPALGADVVTDEEAHFAPSTDWPQDGTTYISFTNRGDRQIVATETIVATVSGKSQQYKMVPDRMLACSTDGHDGNCGTTVLIPPPPQTGADPSPCDTNGHDGNCGTIDTSGPPTTVTNIKNKGVYSKRSAPRKVTGTIALDQTGVKQVLLRLTRVTTTKVAIKPKKKAKKGSKKATRASAAATKKKASKKKRKVRYRTVKRCTYWDTTTLLLEKAKRCGTKYGKWFQAEVTDVPTDFSYSFEMKLPAGRYVLEVQAQDIEGHPEDVAPGRNVLPFTVK